VRVTCTDDLKRSRPTVFFRLLLAIPHIVWLALWSIAVIPVVIIQWFITLFGGTPAASLQRFLSAYIRYSLHLNAYLLLAANPYPGFMGRPGTYPIDVELPEPARQNRWKTGFRALLALPAAIVAGALGTGFSLSVSSSSGTYGASIGGLAGTAALLGWWASVFTARMPKGLRNLSVYSLAYSAQVQAYLLLLTDVYPNSDPLAILAIAEQRPHPIEVTVEDDGARSRATVFFRLLLAIPHLIWLYAFAAIAFAFAIMNWFAALFRGRSVRGLHNFMAAYLRYQTAVYAYVSLINEPWPADFLGKQGAYPIDVRVAEPERQNRWRIFFRLLLAFPAFLLGIGLLSALVVVSVLGWWAALFTARMPTGLRNLGVYALRYQAQVNAYTLLLTEAYPYAGPAVGAGAGDPAPPSLGPTDPILIAPERPF
jgi:Domain of unknown function (DUF4389)